MFRTRKSILSFTVAAASLFSPVVTCAQQTASASPYASIPIEDRIVNLIESGFPVNDNADMWVGLNSENAPKLYALVSDFLKQDPKLGNSVPTAIDAIAVIAGHDSTLAVQAFEALRKYATDDGSYGTDAKLPDAPYIPDAQVSGKIEAIYAIANLAHASAGMADKSDAFFMARSFLVEASEPGFWEKNLKWEVQGRSASNRWKALAQRSAKVLGLLTVIEKGPRDSSPGLKVRPLLEPRILM